jgi:hypothetical protein
MYSGALIALSVREPAMRASSLLPVIRYAVG